MPSSDRLSALPLIQRNELEQLLMEFDDAWTPKRLAQDLRPVLGQASGPYRKLAVLELTKIDIQRRWSAGKGKLLEAYLEQIPALGTTETVSVELILVEYQARSAADAAISLDSYAARFPRQFEQLKELAAVAGSSGGSVRVGVSEQASSIDTSRAQAALDTGAIATGETCSLPQQFGRYRILRELGAGAMGKVYLAHDSQLDRQVAIKTPSFQGGKDDELVARFYREARAAAKIQHRNICPIYDVGEILGRHFISMGFIKGRSMAEYITPNQPPPVKTSAVLVHRIASALAEAHRHNVIHRDLKPANIMIDTKREPVVMDFGLARETDTESRMTQSGMLVGTPAYMSPEQVSGDSSQVGPSADIYALGVILYELLTCTLPFRGSIVQVVHQITSQSPVPPSQIRSEVDADLEAICARMMAKQCHERFASMEQVATALKDYLKGKQRQPSTPAEPRSSGAGTDTVTGPAADPAPQTTSTGAVTETEALNAFFAGQTADKVQQTAVELDLSTTRTRRDGAPVTAANTRRNQHRRVHPAIPWLVGLGGAVLVALGILFVLKMPFGTIRVETHGDLDGLQVFVDGHEISVNSTQKIGPDEHELALRLNGAQLTLDPDSNQFTIRQNGDEHRLAVSIGDIELASKRFTIARGKETVLTIELVPPAARLAAETAPAADTPSGPPPKAVTDKPQPSATRPPLSTVTDSSAENGSTKADSPTSRSPTRSVAPERAEAGWQVLFDGSGTTAWQDLGPFRVENGLLVAARRGNAISRDAYGDFQLEFQWQITRGGNSGVFYRAEASEIRGNPFYIGPEFQLLDNDTHRDGRTSNTSCGALYGLLPPLHDATNPTGDWNTSQIVARGANVEHWLNGQQILTYEIGAPAWQRALQQVTAPNEQGLKANAAARSGHIAIQGHTGQIAFRKIRVRELSPLTSSVTKSPAARASDPAPGSQREGQGWTNPFNGRDLAGWKGLTTHWQWKDNELVGTTPRRGLRFNTNLYSLRTYGNFEIEFEVKLEGRGANSGLQIRSRILDAKKAIAAGPQVDVGPRFWGSLYGERDGGMMKQADKDLANKIVRPNDYNAYAVRCEGQHVTITVNGTTLVDDEFPSMPAAGILGWQLHRGAAMTVRIRNIRLRELPAAADAGSRLNRSQSQSSRSHSPSSAVATQQSPASRLRPSRGPAAKTNRWSWSGSVPANKLLSAFQQPNRLFGLPTYELWYDPAALKAAGISLTQPIRINVRQGTDADVLQAICSELDLLFRVDGNVIRLFPRRGDHGVPVKQLALAASQAATSKNSQGQQRAGRGLGGGGGGFGGGGGTGGGGGK